MDEKQRENLIYTANVYLSSARPAPAEKLLRDILAQEPQNPEAKHLLVYALRDQKRIAEAIHTGRELLAAGYHQELTYRAIAECYYQRNQIPEAIKYHEKALEKNPQSIDSLAQLIMLYYDDYREEEARTAMDLALRLDPLNTFLWWNIWCFYNKAEENTVMEEQALIKLADMDMPKNRYAGLQARTAAKAGRYKEAYEHYKRAFLIDPSDPLSKQQLAEFEQFYLNTPSFLPQ